jgi:transposase
MPDNADRAAAVAFAVTNGARLAAQQFRVSERTIKRWKREAETGKDPELALRVRAEDRERAKRRNDLLDQLFEATARKAMAMVESEASLREITNLLKEVGELRMTRLALGIGQNVGDSDDREGGTPSEDPRRTGCGEDSPGEGATIN